VKLSNEEKCEVTGYLRALDLTFDDAARLAGRHRTTIGKKLAGELDTTPSDLLNLGRAIEREQLGRSA
jgi:hypothetical protein